MTKNILKKYLALKEQEGAVIVIVALCLVLLVAMAALAIDIGYLYSTRSELQNVADAAALAGARYMGAEYKKLDPALMASHTFKQSEILNVVQTVAQKNSAGNKLISIKPEDIDIGLWNPENSQTALYSSTLTGPDGISVIARRDSNINDPISTFFGRLFNINTLDVTSTRAIAALSGPSYVGPGELKTPFGISQYFFSHNKCTDTIAFSPTTDSCAGWHNFFDAINGDAEADKLIGFIQGDTQTYTDSSDGKTLINGSDWLRDNFHLQSTPIPEITPSAEAGDPFEFQGGVISKLFNGDYLTDYNGNYGTHTGNGKKPAAIVALFDYFRYRDGDGDNAVWTSTIPVYADSNTGCTNPHGSKNIVGFAKIVIFSPNPPPYSNLNVHYDCHFTVIEGRGGGTNYGNLKGTIPQLVK